LDGLAVRLRPGQYQVSLPLEPLTDSRGVRRYAVYSVRKKRLRSGFRRGVLRERVLHVLVYTGEEWRVV
jgi:hypothetical protein